jgi:hypothetical protein
MKLCIYIVFIIESGLKFVDTGDAVNWVLQRL